MRTYNSRYGQLLGPKKVEIVVLEIQLLREMREPLVAVIVARVHVPLKKEKK